MSSSFSFPTGYQAPSFNPSIFTSRGIGEAISRYTAPPASKPGTDWLALGAGLSDLFGGIGDVARAVQGAPPSYRMAGSKLQDYLQGQKEETYLKDLLSAILTKGSDSYSSFDPKKGKPVI